jgi:HAE1 family hydrophobic/amphiphilic exporter-1
MLGGLSISTLLTLIVIPVMHSVVDDGTQLFDRLWKRLSLRSAVPTAGFANANAP